jgi:isoquinoline 1-oxidoreductase beta subunit
MKRRTVLLSGAGAAGAAVLGWGALPPRSRLGNAQDWPLGPDEAVALNGWLKIAADGGVQLAMPRCDMGQGIHTALAMLVAEELDVPARQVRCVNAGADTIYGNVGVLLAPLPWRAPPASPAPGTADGGPAPEEGRRVRLGRWLLHKGARELGLQLTAGSSSVMDAWDDLRLAAATARAQLLRAASLRWRQPVDELRTEQGFVHHPRGERVPYGELAAVAAVTRPGDVRLKPPSQWNLIGRPPPRLLSPEPAAPRRFGMDLRWPDLLFATVRHAPALGGDVGALAVEAVLRQPGVMRVVRLGGWAGGTPAVAVVARSTWHALRAARALQADWRPPAAGPVDSKELLQALQAQARQQADAAAAQPPFADAPRRLSAAYSVPYLGHAPLEPTCAVAHVREGRVTLWAASQSPTTARALAARAAGVSEADVTLNALPAGGSFGRRLDGEVIGQVVRVALETQGRPVQLMWSREEDMTHDFYRPAGAAVLQATLDAEGWPLHLGMHSAGDAVTPRWLARQLPRWSTRVDLPDGLLGEGVPTLPYALPSRHHGHVATRGGVPVGPWRSGAHAAFAFYSECFIDELAALGGHDPLHYRLRLLARQPACAAVLRLAAEKAAWDAPPPAGVARGLALHVCAHSIVALVAEVRWRPGQPQPVQVQRVVCAADVGTVVHPAGLVQQLEGGIMFGLNAALWGQVEVVAGQVRPRDFAAGHWLDAAHAPRIETHLVRSPRAPGGAGGIATPVIAPAVANALFRLTGQRVRSLPLLPR